MNKTLTVNIGGIVFHIDENAYERFRLYLESIRAHFASSEGRDEIMQDIESRIAEMFQERIKDLKQVITIFDVDEVTTLMGKPEQFGDEEENKKVSGEVVAGTTIKRRLFRDPDDKVLGGVCSGISAYFNIDPVWIRLIFVAAFLLYGSGFFLYVILWIIIPKAETTADKLQMKGEPVNINNIEKNVQEEMAQEKRKQGDTGRGAGNFINRIFDAIGQLLRFLFVFLGKILAVFFIIIGLFTAFMIFASVLTIFNVPGISYPEVLNRIFSHEYQFGLAFLGAALVFGLPFILLAYLGARLLFNIRKTTRTFRLSVMGLWVGGLLICIFLGASIAKDFSQKQSIRKEIPIHQADGILYLQVNDKYKSDKDYERWDENEWNGDLRLSLKDDQLQSRDIRLDIVESPNDSFQLIQICYARGSSRKTAADHASRITYTFSQNDTAIVFDPIFVLDKDDKYRAQRMQLILQVPRGGKIHLDKSLDGFIYDIENVQNVFDGDMLNRKWEMKEKGLSCMDCDGTESTIGGMKFIPPPPLPNQIHIDDNGVYISGSDKGSVSIDSNGIIIRKGDKTKVIRKGDVKIRIDGEEW